jgi:peptidoglycan/xylan/chitin deacetylase (PgdA/CDA1 family)
MKILFLKKKYVLFAIITTLVFSFSYSIYCTYFENKYVFGQKKIITPVVQNNIKNIYSNKQKYAYLTFDDGPSNEDTEKILDILDRCNIKATFFLVGKEVKLHPEIVKREYSSGHFIANHGYSHNNSKLYKSKESFINEILSTDSAISSAIGVPNFHSHLFRFPNGSKGGFYSPQKKKCIKYLNEIDYTYVDWNVLNNDSIRKFSNENLMKNLKNTFKFKNGTIVILMHDTGDVNKTYDVLEDSINFFKSQGYEFRTFYDFIKD